MDIYLDNSATTPLSENVKRAMTEAMDVYGNPSSLHSAGLSAQRIVDDARSSLGIALGTRMLKAGQIIFTSSGTEANNLAIKGSVYAKSRRGNKIITTDSEHPSVENTLKELEKDGFTVIRISTRGGVLDISQIESAADENVVLATLMMTNNETGAVYDIKKAFSIIKARSPNVVTHCDAVQGFMKRKFTPASINADLVSVSAHKIHGPKGVGALFVSADILKERKLSPIILGGGQENGFRSGTENVIGIAGFGAAIKESFLSLDKNIARMTAVREYAVLKLSSLDIRLNVPLGEFAPHIINFTLPNIKSETMLHYLSGYKIFVSSGSACSSHSNTPSKALTSFGLSSKDADSSIRVSISENTTEEEIDTLVNVLKMGLGVLVRIK